MSSSMVLWRSASHRPAALLALAALLAVTAHAAPLEEDISLDELLSSPQQSALPVQVSDVTRKPVQVSDVTEQAVLPVQGGVSPVIAARCYSISRADVTLLYSVGGIGLLTSPWEPNLTRVIAACCYYR
ncbi:hypothetical protein FJT64_017182 [Amphibalanus amphitrite]|uniref:Uncharacterized protein n=1 Tax=Amphibalanus amphitrite TaxID=1232801 RepID=A0A6A4XC63_AMPAM|nr:hypothetical protein FJT64_017182 [Amphibalanus amphitrite]